MFYSREAITQNANVNNEQKSWLLSELSRKVNIILNIFFLTYLQ